MSETFANVVKQMPVCLGGYDALAMTTLADLAAMTQFEIDLYAEGEESDIRSSRDLRSCRQYLRKLSRSNPKR